MFAALNHHENFVRAELRVLVSLWSLDGSLQTGTPLHRHGPFSSSHMILP